MKFFNLDMHVSVIEDLKRIFGDLGHEVTEWSLSAHCHLFGKTPVNICIGQHNWRNFLLYRDQFVREHGDYLNTFDGFICTYPPAFAMLFESFDKPVFIQVPIRYEEPFGYDANLWTIWNEYLKQGIANKKIFLVANNHYDARYINSWLPEIYIPVIPNLCEYYPHTYAPEYPEALTFTRHFEEWGSGFKSGHGVDWADVVKYKAAVYVPYNCSVMKFFEHYRAGIPMLFPSKKLMLSVIEKNIADGSDELSFNRVHRLGFKSSSLPPKLGRTITDPNEGVPSWDWIEQFDCYKFPHITYFDRFEDIPGILGMMDCDGISRSMRSHYFRDMLPNVYEDWNDILDRAFPGRTKNNVELDKIIAEKQNASGYVWTS